MRVALGGRTAHVVALVLNRAVLESQLEALVQMHFSATAHRTNEIVRTRGLRRALPFLEV